MKRYRKLVSLVLTVLMVLALLPASLAAEETRTDTASLGASALPRLYLPSGVASFNSREPVTGGSNLVDFSENNMLAAAYHTGSPYKYAGDPDSGGTNEMAAAYYARWSGPVNEADDPYPDPSIASNVEYISGLTPVTRVSDILMVPHDDYDSTDDIFYIKQLIYNYGAVSIGIQYDPDNYMNWATRSYYMPSTAVQSSVCGHAVTVVGWDDNYSATNFETNPGSDGAFIIKNSHGTGGQWADGYFYLSYADKCVGKLYKITQTESYNYTSTSAVFVAGDAELESYDHHYQYDPYGDTFNFGLDGTREYYYMANVFKADTNQTLKAVSFYTSEYYVPYEVYVVKGSTVSATLPAITGLTASQASGGQEFPGYHVVKLSKDVTLAQGQYFSVIIRVPGTVERPFCVETPFSEEMNLTTAANQSFIYNAGWEDMTNPLIQFQGNLCISAMTVDGLTGGLSEAPVTGGSEPLAAAAPGESVSVPGESGLTPGVSTVSNKNIPAEQPADIKAPFDPRSIYSEGDALTVGGSGENPFKSGVKLERYNIYSDKGSEISTAGGYPDKYDLRDEGFITSVKDQGGIGSCWTFAPTASLESTYLQALRGVTITGSNYVNAGQSITTTLTANAYSPGSVSSYAWSVTEGADLLQIPGDSGSKDFVLCCKTVGNEGIATVSCTVTYSDGTSKTLQYPLVVANYGVHDTNINNDGSVAHPFEVSTPTGLQLIDCFSGPLSSSLNFKQTADITMPASWSPIGGFENNNPFMGHFDGGGKIITMPALTPASSSMAFGLFGYTDGAVLENILMGPYSDGISDTSQNLSLKVNNNYICGLLVGNAYNTTIQRCSVASDITYTFTTSSNVNVGGLVGEALYSKIDHCSYIGFLGAGSANGSIGGLVGVTGNTTIKSSYFNGIIGNQGPVSMIGGLIGAVINAPNGSVTVNDCYAVETFYFGVSRGGLAGYAMSRCSFTNCYTNMSYLGSGTVAAFAPVANTLATLNNCYYNSQTASPGFITPPTTNKMKPLTAQQMTQQAAFAGFNFTPNTGSWVMVPGQNDNMPVLQKPLGIPTDYKYPSFNHWVYVKDKVQAKFKLNPSFVWPQPIAASPVDTTIASGNANGLITGVKRGTTKVALCVGSSAIGAAIDFTVYDKKADLDHNGVPEYLNSVNALLKWLTGKATPTEDACWLLDADNSCGDNFKANAKPNTLSTDCLELKDLLIMQQANAGIKNNLKNPQ